VLVGNARHALEQSECLGCKTLQKSLDVVVHSRLLARGRLTRSTGTG
jgi:hypothetical protein